MTGIIRFPRGGRPSKVTRPASMAPPRRPASASSSNGAAGASAAATRQALAVEQALSEQQQQQQQQHQHQLQLQQFEAATADDMAVDAAHTLSDGTAFADASQRAHDTLKTPYMDDEADLGGSMVEMLEATRSELDLNLSAAAAAAAAAAVASASQLAQENGGGSSNRHHGAADADTAPPPPQDLQHKAQARDSLDLDGRPVSSPSPSASAPSPQQTPLPQPAASSSAASSPPSTAQMARDSGYLQLTVESALAKRLAREPGLRPATQRRPEQQLNLGRRSNVEALFAHIAGEEVPVPCKNCHKGHGPWTSCIVVDGQMCGSCANCWFNASGARCSFHETKAPMQPAHLLHMHHPQPASPTVAQQQQSHHHHHHHQNDEMQSLSGVPSAAAQQAAAVAVQQLSNGTAGAASSAAVNGSSVLAPPPPSSLSSLGLQLAAAVFAGAGGGGSIGGNGGTPVPLVGYVIDQALAEVRSADQRTRDLMLVEIAAKQLALAIVRCTEGAAAGAGAGGTAPAAAGKAAAGQNSDTAATSAEEDGMAPGQGPDGGV